MVSSTMVGCGVFGQLRAKGFLTGGALVRIRFKRYASVITEGYGGDLG